MQPDKNFPLSAYSPDKAGHLCLNQDAKTIQEASKDIKQNIVHYSGIPVPVYPFGLVVIACLNYFLSVGRTLTLYTPI
jgi:hypothetical protein